MDLKISFLVWICAVVGSYGHSMKSGGCPRVKVMKDFDMDKFLGDWYVMQRSNPVSTCTKISIEKDKEGIYTASETSRPFGINFRGFDDHSRRPRKLTFLRDDTKSIFQVQRTFPHFTLKTFGVVDTDYDNYAVVWGCDPFLMASIQNGDILSRHRDTSPETIKAARAELKEMGVDVRPMKNVDQSRCDEKKDESEVDVHGSNMVVDGE